MTCNVGEVFFIESNKSKTCRVSVIYNILNFNTEFQRVGGHHLLEHYVLNIVRNKFVEYYNNIVISGYTVYDHIYLLFEIENEVNVIGAFLQILYNELTDLTKDLEVLNKEKEKVLLEIGKKKNYKLSLIKNSFLTDNILYFHPIGTNMVESCTFNQLKEELEFSHPRIIINGKKLNDVRIVEGLARLGKKVSFKSELSIPVYNNLKTNEREKVLLNKKNQVINMYIELERIYNEFDDFLMDFIINRKIIDILTDIYIKNKDIDFIIEIKGFNIIRYQKIKIMFKSDENIKDFFYCFDSIIDSTFINQNNLSSYILELDEQQLNSIKNSFYIENILLQNKLYNVPKMLNNPKDNKFFSEKMSVFNNSANLHDINKKFKERIIKYILE